MFHSEKNAHFISGGVLGNNDREKKVYSLSSEYNLIFFNLLVKMYLSNIH